MERFTINDQEFEACSLADAITMALVHAAALAKQGLLPAATCMESAARNLLTIHGGPRPPAAVPGRTRPERERRFARR